MCEKPLCWVCGERPPFCHGRCVRCHSYWRRTGKERPKGLKASKLCRNCKTKPASKGSTLCGACRIYKSRNGEDRPKHLTYRVEEKEKSAKWCKNCGHPDIWALQRCELCYHYYCEHGKERPKHLWIDNPSCKNCSKPLPVNGRRFSSGKCVLCREYERKFGRPRPNHLWGNGKEGWCECGKAANHLIDKFPLCDGCAVEYQKGAYS